MLKPVVRPSPFATLPEQQVVARPDSSFTGRLSAFAGAYSTTSNLIDGGNLDHARRNPLEELDITDEDLLRGQQPQDHAAILLEKNTYGKNAARVMAKQTYQDRQNEQVMHGVSGFKSLLYGGAAILADPVNWIPMAASARVGMGVTKLVKPLSSSLATATGWATGGAIDAVTINTPRLKGDHTYTMEQYQTDLLVETALAGGIGLALKYGSKAALAGKRQHAERQARLEETFERNNRKSTGDLSDAAVTTSEANIVGDTLNGMKFDGDAVKGTHLSMRALNTDLTDSVRRFRADKDVGEEVVGAVEKEMADIAERISRAREPHELVSILDDMRVLRGNVNKVESNLPDYVKAKHELSEDQLRRRLREDVRGELSRVLRDPDAKVMDKGDYAKVIATRSGEVAEVLKRLKQADNVVADEVAMILTKLDMFYKGRTPNSMTAGIAAITNAINAGDIAHALEYSKTLSKVVPAETPSTYKYKGDGHIEDVASEADAIQHGDVSITDIRDALDALPPEMAQQVKGANAVFGNVDDSGVVIPKEAAERLASKMVDVSGSRIANAIKRYELTGEKAAVENAAKAPHVAGWIGHHLGRMLGLTRDMSSTLRETDSDVLNFLGSRVLELGKGYSGVTKRRHTTAVIKEAELTQSLAKVLPSYYRNIQEWVGLQGESAVAAYNAANKASHQNALADKFNKEFLSIMNKRSLGKQVDEMSAPMKNLVKDWDNYMEHNFDKMVVNGIEGFSASRKVISYVPQIWNKGKIPQLLARHGEETILQVLTAGYRSTGTKNPEGAAKSMLEWLRKPHAGANEVDQYLPKVDARAQERMAIDWDAEVNGVSVMDMLHTDAPMLATRYSNRMSGWVGLSKATDGALSNGLDINTARKMLEIELRDKGKSVKQIANSVGMYEETMNLVFGRPPVAPLDPFVNNLKELAVLSRMGGLGMAQAAESGVVATRSIMEATADPKFLRKVLSRADTNDLQELVRLSGYDKDYALLSRQSVEQAIEEEGRGISSTAVSKLNKAVDFLTFGSNKAAGSRALGQVTGYDAIRKAQSYVSQRSFGMSVARHFNGAETKLSHGRLADWGLTDAKGVNKGMERMFKQHVEFDADGYPKSFNFDKWDTKQLDDFRYAMQRMEAQTQARALAGELPRWMNYPMMGIITQFRQMAVTTQNKTLARNLALADQEAIAELALATMSASVIRAVKLGGLAAVGVSLTDTTWEADFKRRIALAENDKLMPLGADMYVNHFGAFSDIYNTTNMLMNDMTKASREETVTGAVGQALKSLPRQIPVLGVMEGYMKTGGSLVEGDLIEAGKDIQRMAILGNTAVVESLAGALLNSLEE